ncbi:MAG TPA: membrane protein insertase YidC, partial [Ramlibacter sp.]|nr:membrane protein insertase YidC [Ramlibacter sp.]
MTDIRRTILWVIFGFSLVMLWDQWQVYNGKQATFFPSGKPAATAPAPSGPASVPGQVAAAPGAVPAPTAAAPATGTAAVPGTAAAAPTAPREEVVVTTDVMRVTFDTEGGSVIHTEFPKIEGAQPGEPFVLLDQSANRVYVAQSGLIGGEFPNHKTPMTVTTGERTLVDGREELVVRFESPVQNGVKLVKTYTLKRGDYAMRVRHEIVNAGAAPVSPQLYVQLTRDGNPLPGESSFYSTFTGPAVY